MQNLMKPLEDVYLESNEFTLPKRRKETLVRAIRRAREANPWLDNLSEDLASLTFAHFEQEWPKLEKKSGVYFYCTVKNFITKKLLSNEFQAERLAVKSCDEDRGIVHKSIDDLIAEGNEKVIIHLYKSKDVGDRHDFHEFCDWCKMVNGYPYVKAYVVYGTVREAAEALSKNFGCKVSKSTVHNILTWLVKNFPW